ncbi:hypothetical protein BU23DRAFT_557496, partial [Bimuria novae-zelandiae CBS 107.79]
MEWQYTHFNLGSVEDLPTLERFPLDLNEDAELSNEPSLPQRSDWDRSIEMPHDQPSSDDINASGFSSDPLQPQSSDWTSSDDLPGGASSDYSALTDSSSDSDQVHHPDCGCCREEHYCLCVYDWRVGAAQAAWKIFSKGETPKPPRHLETFRMRKAVQGDQYGNGESW